MATVCHCREDRRDFREDFRGQVRVCCNFVAPGIKAGLEFNEPREQTVKQINRFQIPSRYDDMEAEPVTSISHEEASLLIKKRYTLMQMHNFIRLIAVMLGSIVNSPFGVQAQIALPMLPVQDEFELTGEIKVKNSSEFVTGAVKADSDGAKMIPVLEYEVQVQEIKSGVRHRVRAETTINGSADTRITDILDGNNSKFFLTKFQGSDAQLRNHVYGDIQSSTSHVISPAIISELITLPLAGRRSVAAELKHILQSDKKHRSEGTTTYSLSLSDSGQKPMLELVIDKTGNRVVGIKQYAITPDNHKRRVPFRMVDYNISPDWSGSSEIIVRDYRQDSKGQPYVATEARATFTVSFVIPPGFQLSKLHDEHPAKGSDPVQLLLEGGQGNTTFNNLLSQLR